MTIETVGFDTVVSNQDWKVIKTGLEVILIASPPKGRDTAFFGYVDGNHKSPIFIFKSNSIIRIRGGELIFDTDDIIKPKLKKMKR